MPPPTQAAKPVQTSQAEPPQTNETMPIHRLSQANNTALTKSQTSSQKPLKSPKPRNGDINPHGMRIEGLAMVKNASLEKEATKARRSPVAIGADSTEDDQSHLSNNSSREPPSFDTKSIASATTFAMDEKDSLRPDDSASVQAVDDEDSSSASCNPSIQGESEQGVLPGLMTHLNGNVVGIARRFPSINLANPPRFGDLPMSPITETEEMRQVRGLPQETAMMEIPRIRGGGVEIRPQILAVMPDEKLLDALASLKDRLPLLQLEEKIVSFIIESHKGGPEVLDLPPQNSFGRLLAHKLADYYCLQHVISDDSNSVRLYRMRGMSYSLPTSLATIATSIATGPVPASGSAAFKIMRRNGLGGRVNSAGGSTAASSSAPSKATSENGADGSDEGFVSPPDGTPQRDRSTLTREEREANYKAARDRIFGDFRESLPSEAASMTGETSASISRSSSSSGKRKTGKQRRPKDDSFEARSQFVQGAFPPMPIVGQQNPYQGAYNEPAFPMQYSGNPSNIGATFGSTPTQAYPGFDNNMSYSGMPNYSNIMQQSYPPNEPWSPPQPQELGNWSGYPPNQTQSVYASPQTPVSGISQYNQAMSMPPTQMSQSWSQNQFQNSFQQTPTLQNPQPVQWPTYSPAPNSTGPNPIPYPYGQLPPQPYPSPVYNAQHPVPGSYNGNRSLFNPNSRSFVPSNTTSRSGGRNNNRKKNGNGNQKSKCASATTSASTDGGMPIPQRPSQPASSSSSSPGAKDLRTLYGAPAHLPKKPPPSQVPVQFELDLQALKLGSTGGPLVVNSGGEGRA